MVRRQQTFELSNRATKPKEESTVGWIWSQVDIFLPFSLKMLFNRANDYTQVTMSVDHSLQVWLRGTMPKKTPNGANIPNPKRLKFLSSNSVYLNGDIYCKVENCVKEFDLFF